MTNIIEILNSLFLAIYIFYIGKIIHDLSYKISKKISLIIFILILIILINQIHRIKNIIMMIILFGLSIILLKKEQKLETIKLKYKELNNYNIQNEKTIISYRKINHEHKNKLIIIKSMINTNNEELKKYLDYLIDEPVSIENKWLNKLSAIPLPEIKNFINYKLNKLEQKKAKIELFIGEELSKINPNKIKIIDINNINTIIGIILDNMIESIEQTKEKLISINVYIEKNTINILLANNIEDHIDIDKINKLGYSTKGKKRGIGLTIVSDIIQKTKKLELETKIEEKFFIQHLKIKNIKKYLKKQ